VTGAPGSGRTSAVAAIVESVLRHRPGTHAFQIGSAPSILTGLPLWKVTLNGVDEVVRGVPELLAQLDVSGAAPAVLVLEGLPDFLSTPADSALQTLIKSADRRGHFVICEGEVGAFTSSYPLLMTARSARTGFCLQPDQLDGSVLRTDFPRCRRSDFPAGRGFYVRRGMTTTVQLALPTSAHEISLGQGSSTHSASLTASLP
jgi:S-DNA-T family DNA segregation ATPase FtsK/SpoIIIE